MKYLDVKKIIRVSSFVLSFAVMTSLSTSAQPNGNNNNNARGGDRTDNTRTETTRVVEQRDDDTDWGWLGLLGLLGLAGLIPKKRKVEVQEFRDVNQAVPPPAAAPRNTP